MGLDMYAYSMKSEYAKGKDIDLCPVDELEIELSELKRIKRWRKFNHLHGWMMDLYYKKGGKSHDFNCNSVKLELLDLEKLKYDIEHNNLSYTPGPFFGSIEIWEEDIESTKEFIENAKELINNGYTVFYDSCW